MLLQNNVSITTPFIHTISGYRGEVGVRTVHLCLGPFCNAGHGPRPLRMRFFKIFPSLIYQCIVCQNRKMKA